MNRLVLAALRTRTRTPSDRTVLVLGSDLLNVPPRPGQRTGRRWNFGLEDESKAEEGKRVAACPFAVPDNRDAAIEDEPSSTSTCTVRLRVLSTSTRGSILWSRKPERHASAGRRGMRRFQYRADRRLRCMRLCDITAFDTIERVE